MSNEFKREERYIVFKMSDMVEHFTTTEALQLARLYEIQRVGRKEAGKSELECVVVEKGWPEYEPTWRAIEARVTGAQPTPTTAEQDQINAEAAIRSSYVAWPKDEVLWQTIANGMITPAHMAQAVADGTITPAYIMQPAPSVPECWLPVPEKHPTFDPVDLQLSDGSVLCGCVPQSDGDYWWEGPSGEVFIDPKYASVTHWRLAAAPEAKP